MNDLSAATGEAARQENIARILDTAERLFKHYGYAKTNVADIARDLSMSPANIYRFFSSKSEIHQALAKRMLKAQYEVLHANACGPGSASDRLSNHLVLQHRITMETMLDEKKVHEMVLVAIEQQWQVIEEHLTKICQLVRDVIEEGIANGEFRQQDSLMAAECFMECGVSVCHPQILSKKLAKDDVVGPEDLAAFILRALK